MVILCDRRSTPRCSLSSFVFSLEKNVNLQFKSILILVVGGFMHICSGNLTVKTIIYVGI